MDPRDEIALLVKKWISALDMDRWKIAVRFNEEPQENSAGCIAKPEYREAMITFNLANLSSERDLEEHVVHELVHCITWPLTEVADTYAQDVKSQGVARWADVATEQVTTDVADIILKLVRQKGNE